VKVNDTVGERTHSPGLVDLNTDHPTIAYDGSQVQNTEESTTDRRRVSSSCSQSAEKGRSGGTRTCH
jgi:hypothetical protein